MDKMILSVGIVLIVLGIVFLAIASTDYNLSSAYTTGGYLWLLVGGITAGVGMKVNRPSKQLDAMR